MQAIRQHKLIHLWLVATLVVVFGTGLVLRPDRDVAKYLKHQDFGVYPKDLQARHLATQIRLLQETGLAHDQIKHRLLSNGRPTAESVNRIMEWMAAMEAKQQAAERLTLFATIALVPPLIVLELGLALFWLRRGHIDRPPRTHVSPKSLTASRDSKARDVQPRASHQTGNANAR